VMVNDGDFTPGGKSLQHITRIAEIDHVNFTAVRDLWQWLAIADRLISSGIPKGHPCSPSGGEAIGAVSVVKDEDRNHSVVGV